jgi:hypothetical protein
VVCCNNVEIVCLNVVVDAGGARAIGRRWCGSVRSCFFAGVGLSGEWWEAVL